MRKALTRKQQAQARRDQLIDTALHLFAQKGFSATTIADLARETGVAEGLVYHYFDSKLDLLKATIERHAFVPRLRVMMTPLPDEAVESVLLRVAREWWSLMQEKRAFVVMVFGESQRNPELARLLGELGKEGTMLVTRYLETRAKKGELFPGANCYVAARMFMNSIFMFFLQQSHMTPPMKKMAPDDYLAESVRLIVRGLTKCADHRRRVRT